MLEGISEKATIDRKISSEDILFPLWEEKESVELRSEYYFSIEILFA